MHNEETKIVPRDERTPIIIEIISLYARLSGAYAHLPEKADDYARKARANYSHFLPEDLALVHDRLSRELKGLQALEEKSTESQEDFDDRIEKLKNRINPKF